MTPRDAKLLEVLGDLERAEARLLVWGVVDGAMPEQEVLDRIEESCTRHDLDESSAVVLEDLLDRHLLFEVEDLEEAGFRTRMAEAVRLFSRLRQWRHGRTWLDAPSLVADFRFDLRPRSYPRREHLPADVSAALSSVLSDSRSREALEAMLTARGDQGERQLAEFQIEATERILRGLALERDGGTIVTSGTGSGKTLAFYLPALVWLAQEIDQAHATRVIAIYPRNELLKDQLVQCLGELDRLGDVSVRPVRIGALFGPTPGQVKWVEEGFAPWPVHAAGGRRCPYVQCPRCRSPLIWTDADRQKGTERLRCVGCTFASAEGQFAMTRDSIRERPPDILFTTTEMLNRLSSSVQFAHVIGAGANKRPRLMLLDEVHTYGGSSGAQVAHLLRRWHFAAGGRVHFVGLSATLRDASGFFARLTGLRESVVREITPSPDAMRQRGMEYMLALRGNPMSSTALLSTTIQALMLAARMVDSSGIDGSGVAGSRVFAFTDKLDLANRLFHFYSDAEGWGPYERPLNRPSLATLRAPSGTDGDRQQRRRAGQVWDAPAEIGHDLQAGRKRVGITTSQRAGVQDRDVIIATASLEVGYNDEQVGVVLQHKAPRDPAAFIQRRGRGGRLPEQRPWTVVVLSDFGRDRIAYQSYERLFDPALPARSLPIANQAVRRMQAAFASLDWLAKQRTRGYSVWDDLTKPRNTPGQQALADAIERTLRDPVLRHDLETHLSRALGIERDEARALLWSPPRSIVLEMLPTALRRLTSGWFHGVKGPREDLQAPNSPLPDFMPANLFTDLQLPEVTVTVPPQQRRDEAADHELPVFLALTEFAPGNVSFRYAIEGRWAASWIAPQETGSTLDIDAFCITYDDLGEVMDGGLPRRFLRPWHIGTERRPANVLDTSRGWLRWAGGPQSSEGGTHVDLPEDSPWEGVVRRAEAHLHATQQIVKVQRYASGYEADVGYQSGEHHQVTGDFTSGGKPAALGFEYDADALAFHIDVPEHDLLPDPTEPVRLRGFRAACFADALNRDIALCGLASVFQREQLERSYLACLADEALQLELDLPNARLSIGTAIHDRLVDAVDALFSTADEFGAPARGLDELRDLARSPSVIARLDHAAERLWVPFDAAQVEWARDRFASTVAAVISDAAQALCPEFDIESEAVIDITEISASRRIIWIVETSPGGGGLVETLQRRMLTRPRHFISLLDRAVRPSDFEIVDISLRSVLADIGAGTSHLRATFAAFRDAKTNEQRLDCVRSIRRELARLEVAPTHAVVAALAARILRHGSSEATDEALALLAQQWEHAEQRLGVELETSVFAYTQRDRADYDALLGTASGSDVQLLRIGAIFSSLWARGWRARAEGLRAYSPYSAFPPTDRLALDRFRSSIAPAIDATTPDWRAQVDEQLCKRGIAVIQADSRESVARAVREVTVDPTDTGSLLLHPVVAGVDLAGNQVRATLLLDEGVTP